MKQELMTVAEVAKLLRLSKRTIQRLVQRKELVGYTFHGVYRIPREAVVIYMEKALAREATLF